MSTLLSLKSRDSSSSLEPVLDLSAETLSDQVVGWHTLYRNPRVTAQELLAVVMQLDLPLSGYFATAAAIVEGGDAHALQFRRDKVTRYDEGHIFYNALEINRINHEVRDTTGRTNPGAVAQYLRFPSHSDGILGLEKTAASLLTGVLHDVHEDARAAHPNPESLCEKLFATAEQLREQCGFKQEDLPEDYYSELRSTIEDGVLGAWILAKYDPDLFPHETAEDRKSRSRELYQVILLEHPHLLLPKLADVWSNLRSDMPRLLETPERAQELYQAWHGKLQSNGYASFRELALSIYGPRLQVVDEIDEMLLLICTETASQRGLTASVEELLDDLLRSDISTIEEGIDPDLLRILRIAESRKNLYFSEEQHLLTNNLARLISSGCLASLRDKQGLADLLVECLKSGLPREVRQQYQGARSSRETLVSIFEYYCSLDDNSFRVQALKISEWAEGLGRLDSRVRYLASSASPYLEEAVQLVAPSLLSESNSKSIEMMVAEYLQNRISCGQSDSDSLELLRSEIEQTLVVLDQVVTHAELIRRNIESPRFQVWDTTAEVARLLRTTDPKSLSDELVAELRSFQRSASYWSGEPFLLQWMIFRAEQLFGRDNVSTILLASYHDEPQSEFITLDPQTLRESWPESLEECYLRGVAGRSALRIPREIAVILLPGLGWTEEELTLRLHETALARGPKNEPQKTGRAPTSALRDEIGLILRKSDVFHVIKQLFDWRDGDCNTLLLPELEYIALSQLPDLRAMIDNSKGTAFRGPKSSDSSAPNSRAFSGAFDYKGPTHIKLQISEERIPYVDHLNSRIIALEAPATLSVTWEGGGTGIVVPVRTEVFSIISSDEVVLGRVLYSHDGQRQEVICELIQRMMQ